MVTKTKHCIILHLHYQDLWPEFWSYLKDIKGTHHDIVGNSYTTDVYVTVHTTETEWYEDVKANVTEVFVIENRGVELGGYLYCLDQIKGINYVTATLLHGKKSLQPNSNAEKMTEWRRASYEPLIRTRRDYFDVCSMFNECSRLYVVGSQQVICTDARPTYKHEFQSMNLLHSLLTGVELDFTSGMRTFFCGSMFVASLDYLDLVFKGRELEIYKKLELGFDPVTKYTITSSTIAHAFERIVGGEVLVNYYGGYLLTKQAIRWLD